MKIKWPRRTGRRSLPVKKIKMGDTFEYPYCGEKVKAVIYFAAIMKQPGSQELVIRARIVSRRKI